MKHVFCFLLASLLIGKGVLAQSTATYEVIFSASWSAQTHPDDFPGNPHFSGLIGLTHDSTFTLWEAGGLASAGMESMAEIGSKSPLSVEVDQVIAAGSGYNLLSGGGVGNSPGDVSLMFEVAATHPLVSLVSMIAPSPDWFIGVSGASLQQNGEWVESRSDTLYVYDAGTDSGVSYTSPNADTDPAEPIQRIEASPFAAAGNLIPVGTFTFTRADQQPTQTESDLPHSISLSVYPNPAHSYIDVEFENTTNEYVAVHIYTMTGRLVLEEGSWLTHTGLNRQRIPVSNLARGAYLLSLLDSSGKRQHRSVFILK